MVGFSLFSDFHYIYVLKMFLAFYQVLRSILDPKLLHAVLLPKHMFSLLEKCGDARIKEVINFRWRAYLDSPCIQTMILGKKCSPTSSVMII
jgi:hypothetical protein